jgi:hypothetical protein
MKTDWAFPTKLRVLLASAAAVMSGNLVFTPTFVVAQGGVPLWTNVLPGAGGSIAVDTIGNVFVSAGGVVVKYSNAGLPLWTNMGGGAIAVDASGRAFVSGNGTIAYSSAGVPLWTNQLSGSAIAVDGNGQVFVSSSSATAAYSNAGLPLWTNRYTDISQGPYKIAINSSGKVFVAGTMWNGSNNDYVSLAFSNTGVSLWTNRYSGPGNAYDSLVGLAADSSGNVFVTGSSSGFYATIKYSNEGVPSWTNRYNNSQWTPTDSASAIAVDGHGNVFVTGQSCAPVGGGWPDYVTIKYSNVGVPLWTNRYDGLGQYSDYPSAIALDSSGNVFVTGISMYDLPGSPRPADYATIAYSNQGTPLWVNAYGAPDPINNWAKAIAVDSLGNVFVTGDSWANDGSHYCTTIKHSSSIPPPVNLGFQRLNNRLVLTWTNAGFGLQSAPSVTGPFTNITNATSPYTNSLGAPRQFFRLISN